MVLASWAIEGRDHPSWGSMPGRGWCSALAYLTVEFCCFPLFVLKHTIYKLAFPGETPSPVGEPCESLQPALCCRMAAWVPTPELQLGALCPPFCLPWP